MHVPSLLLGATVSLVLVSVYLKIYGHDVVYPFLGTSKQGKWIDLTHDFSEETLYWPTSDSFRLETAFAGTTPAGFYYSAYKYSASEHGGTHLGIECNEISECLTIQIRRPKTFRRGSKWPCRDTTFSVNQTRRKG